MQMVRLTFLAVLLLASSASAQGDRMFIDHVDTSQYEKNGGLLRYYVDLIDAQNKPVDRLSPDTLTFFVNTDLIASEKILSKELRTFEELGETFAVAILFTNYRGYLQRSAGEPSMFNYAKEGIKGFVGNMAKQRVRIKVDVYNEQGIDPIVEFTESQKQVKEAIEGMQEPIFIESEDAAAGQEEQTIIPDFYRHLDETVKKMAALDDLPRRRLLIVISDGKGKETGAKKRVLDTKLETIVEEANQAGIKICAFGASLDDTEYLPYLSRVAERTFGIFQKVDEPEALEGAIRELAPKLLKQYVIDIRTPGLPNEKVNLRIDAETPNKQKVSHTFPKQVLIPPTPVNWKYILTWVGIGVGGLIGLILTWWFIKKIKGWATRAPAEEEEEAADAPYTGPHKGVLRVKTGPLAGQVFHLIEEITTIGSLEGNQIVLQTAGVSKRHAGIKIEDMRYELADFNSTNGTWVNGRKINRQFLKDGDEIRVGDSEMSFGLK